VVARRLGQSKEEIAERDSSDADDDYGPTAAPKKAASVVQNPSPKTQKDAPTKKSSQPATPATIRRSVGSPVKAKLTAAVKQDIGSWGLWSDRDESPAITARDLEPPSTGYRGTYGRIHGTYAEQYQVIITNSSSRARDVLTRHACRHVA
jgi:hypothetical protein